MHGKKDGPAPGQYDTGSRTVEVFSTMRRQIGPTVGWFVVIGVLIAGSALFFAGGLSEVGPRIAPVVSSREPAALVEAVAFSPDGRRIASCGWDASVWVWDVGGNDIQRERDPICLKHDSTRLTLAFSGDGQFLASGGTNSLAIWLNQSETYEPLVEETGLTVRCMAFSPNGRTLAIGGDDGAVRLWDTATWRERAILLEHTDAVRSLAFAADSRRLVSSGQDRRVMLWDAIDGVAIRQLCQPGPDPVQLAAFSPDGETVAIGEPSGVPYDVGLVDPETGALRAKLSGHGAGIRAMAFSPDGTTLATAGNDGCIRLWNLTIGKERRTISDRGGIVRAMAFSPDGAQLVFPDVDKNLRLLNLRPAGARLFSRVLTRNAAPREPTARPPVHS
jgi:WD40 repeat protein